ncbi:hypothetical protein Tco_0337537 [Tanacetum coccineum]
MIEPNKSLKKKYQIKFDEEMAKRLAEELQAELEEEEERADYELDQRLQVEEQRELTIKERSELFIELMVKRKKHFAKLRAEEIRRKPPTKDQKRNQMCTYLKNMANYKHKGSKKRTRKELDEESVKRQKLEDDAEKAELKACLEIVPDDDSAINVESLATKYPIVDWKTHILAEDKIQDVLDQYRLVKERFETTSPKGYDRLLWGDLITLFKLSEEDEIWKAQQDYIMISWRCFSDLSSHYTRSEEMFKDILLMKIKLIIKKLEDSKGLHLKVSYTTMSHPKGVVYLGKHKQKMLMRADEIHKFSDGMLNKTFNVEPYNSLGRMCNQASRQMVVAILAESGKNLCDSIIESIVDKVCTKRKMDSDSAATPNKTKHNTY